MLQNNTTFRFSSPVFMVCYAFSYKGRRVTSQQNKNDFASFLLAIWFAFIRMRSWESWNFGILCFCYEKYVCILTYNCKWFLTCIIALIKTIFLLRRMIFFNEKFSLYCKEKWQYLIEQKNVGLFFCLLRQIKFFSSDKILNAHIPVTFVWRKVFTVFLLRKVTKYWYIDL